MARTRLDLQKWFWRLADSNNAPEAERLPHLRKWNPCAAFPSVIQQELIAASIIPNYHIGENERQIQWVGACDWEYQTIFPTPKNLGSEVDLVFEGLDTYAEVRLNGSVILKSENMFIPARVAAKRLLRGEEQENELLIIFESALKVGSRLEEKYGKRRSMMRDRRRMHLRKAQVLQPTHLEPGYK